MIVYEGLGALLPHIVEKFREGVSYLPLPYCHQSANPPPQFFDSFSVNNGNWILDTRENRRSFFSWGFPARLMLQALPPPGIGSEVFSRDSFGYGIYRFRVRFSSCDFSRGENLSNGVFLYFHDSKDHNQNGIEDNSEIDFEFACSEPQSLYMTTWTDYTNDANFIKQTRRIDFATGEVWQTAEGRENLPGLSRRWEESRFQRPGLEFNQTFHEMGFDWSERSLRFFLVLPGEELELWKVENVRVIPHLPGNFRFNLRSSPEHWSTGRPAFSPQRSSEMDIDCFSYEPQNAQR